MKIRGKPFVKRLCWGLAIVFILMNVVAYLQAYRFTHFSESAVNKTKSPGGLSVAEKIGVIFTGLDNPRPVNGPKPTRTFIPVRIRSNKMLDCWYIPVEANTLSKGTVILFHGYGGEKSALLDKSDLFLSQGFNTLLVDFMGSGGSEGDQTTIGFKEAEEVKSCFEYLFNKGSEKIYLFGTSMGAVAILKALHDYPLQPAGIIIECPFGSLYRTTCARFRAMGLPVFPMAGLLDFWGGMQNGFPAFAFKPVDYAASVECPCLLLYGEKDEKVSRQEIDEIYNNLRGIKVLRTYPLAGHDNYLVRYEPEWTKDISFFLGITGR